MCVNREQTTKTVYLIYTAVLTDVQADCPNRLKTVSLVKQLLFDKKILQDTVGTLKKV